VLRIRTIRELAHDHDVNDDRRHGIASAQTSTFVSRPEAIESVAVGSHEDWLAYSDHSP
jgi:hypothetical protein